jgi:hypothetical protein
MDISSSKWEKMALIGRHFPAFSFFGEHVSYFYINGMGSMTFVKHLKTADTIHVCISIWFLPLG